LSYQGIEMAADASWSKAQALSEHDRSRRTVLQNGASYPLPGGLILILTSFNGTPFERVAASDRL
jgi:hypothetical protein